MINVLVTGAGGPAGVAVIRSLLAREDVTVFAADMDGWASGLYLVPPSQRRLVPPGLAEHFVAETQRICRDDRIDVLFATVDVELPPLAREREALASQGTLLAAPSLATLETCLDKFRLAEVCAPLLRVPRTRLLNAAGVAEDWNFPVIVKPRSGSGSRGVIEVSDREALAALPLDDQTIIQEMLPGEEFSVDVLADLDGTVRAAVPRSRTRVDSGVSIAGMTVKNAALSDTATAVAQAIGLTGVANVQLRYDTAGVPALLEVNPRFPGAMPLTIASGVNMPSLLLDALTGTAMPEHIEFAEIANVRFLEDVFLRAEDILGR